MTKGTALELSGLRDVDGATVTFYATKAAAHAALRDLNLGAEVRPERAANRFFRFWVIAAAPVGDPGEGRVLLTAQRGWTIVCAVACVHVQPGLSYCPGHPMSAEESQEFTLVLCGHRTEVISIGTSRHIEGIDWVTHRPYSDDIPAGSLHRARCLCGWRSGLIEERRYAGHAARSHELAAA